MANRFESIYSSYKEMALEIKDKYKYENLSSAFGHVVIKLLFGISDDEIFDLNTDGYDDNGIDAIYIDNNDENNLHLFQFKFPNNISGLSGGVSETDIDKIFLGFESFVSNDDTFNMLTWNDVLKEKRKDFLSENIYHYKIWIIRFSTSTINDKILNRLENYRNNYVENTGNYLETEVLTATKLSTLFENNIKNKWCDFILRYKKSLNPFSDEISSIYSGYIPLNEIYNSFYSIKDKVFEGNVRYLNSKSKINEGIKNTLETKERVFFHLLNNGITIFCKSCKDNAANEYFDIKNGSIINGAQTVGTIINYLHTLDEEVRKTYNSQYVYVRIVQMDKKEEILDRMVYTLNTQNEMKNSYSISNEIELKQLQKLFNEKTKYYLELKNNEFNFYKENHPQTKKMLKDKIDVETLIQAITAYYDVEGLAPTVKNNKSSLFEKGKIEKIIEKLDFESSLHIYECYLKLMDIISSYRSFRKNSDNKAILSIINISENEIDDYRFLNTGNFFVLYGIGVLELNCDVICNDDYIVALIKLAKDIFTGNNNVSLSTRLRSNLDNYKKKILNNYK